MLINIKTSSYASSKYGTRLMLIRNNYTRVVKTGFHELHTAFISLIHQYFRSIRINEDIIFFTNENINKILIINTSSFLNIHLKEMNTCHLKRFILSSFFHHSISQLLSGDPCLCCGFIDAKLFLFATILRYLMCNLY